MRRGASTAAAAAGSGGGGGLNIGGGGLLVNHLLQHTLRSLCSQPHHPQFWVYSIFWRILPRNYPPPKWDNDAGPFDRSKGNKRNWILVWEDGYCDFVACDTECKVEASGEEGAGQEEQINAGPLQPELFFKMSHDVYNYGEGLMGKIAAERSHKWIFRDPSEQDKVSFLSSWQASADSYPRTWEAQFKAGIQTIAIIAVGEGLLQLGSTRKVLQDVDFVLMLQRKFSYLQSIPGVFAQTKMTRAANAIYNMSTQQSEGQLDVKPNVKHKKPIVLSGLINKPAAVQQQQLDNINEAEDEACSTFPMLPLNTAAPLHLAPSPTTAVDVPSMYNSLQALLSKLPAVIPPDACLGQLSNSSTTRPALIGTSRAEFWPSSHRTALLRPSLPPSSTNSSLPTTSDDFDSYRCLFGQPIS